MGVVAVGGVVVAAGEGVTFVEGMVHCCGMDLCKCDLFSGLVSVERNFL